MGRVPPPPPRRFDELALLLHWAELLGGVESGPEPEPMIPVMTADEVRAEWPGYRSLTDD